MSNSVNEFIKALHTIRDFCLSVNCEECPQFRANGFFVCEFKPYLWGNIPSPDEAPTVEARPHGEWEFIGENLFKCTHCGYIADADYLRKWKVHTYDAEFPTACLNCGASMSANDRKVTGKLNSEIEKSKSEIVPDYRDGWRLKEGDSDA